MSRAWVNLLTWLLIGCLLLCSQLGANTTLDINYNSKVSAPGDVAGWRSGGARDAVDPLSGVRGRPAHRGGVRVPDRAYRLLLHRLVLAQAGPPAQTRHMDATRQCRLQLMRSKGDGHYVVCMDVWGIGSSK